MTPIGLGLAGGRLGLGLAQGAGSAAVPWYRAGGAPLPVAAYQPKGAASLAASYVNLASPGTYDLTMVGTEFAWSSSGLSIVGSNDRYLSTGIVPGDDWSMAIQFADYSSGWLPGSFVNGTATRFGLNPAVGGRGYFFGNGFWVAGTNISSGNLILTKTTGYYNGAVDASLSASWSGTGLPVTVPGLNGYDMAGTWRKVALAIWSTRLTPTMAAAISAAMAAL